jgi:hypothetical protein
VSRSALAPEECIDVTSAVHEGNYMHLIIGNDFVDEAIALANNQFSQTIVTALRHHSTAPRELAKGLGGCLRVSL